MTQVALPLSATVRFVPVVTPAGLTRLPLFLVFGYIVATFVLFLLWPVNWPIYYSAGWARLIGYVCLCLAVIGWTTLWDSTGPTPVTAPLPLLTVLLVTGAAA